MIEVKEILADFEEIDLRTLSSDYGISDEKANIAVSLYNKALNKMNVGSYDAARIDLRKSVNMYPSFVESRMLLGVCVFALGERTDAVAIFNTIKGENRERALNYLDKLHELSTRPESASFRNSSRQNRVPESVYVPDNKLDAIMKATEEQRSKDEEDTSENDSFDDSFDSETEIDVGTADEIHDEDSDVVTTTEDNSDNSQNVAEEKNVSDLEPVAAYSSMRRSQRRPVMRAENNTEETPVQTSNTSSRQRSERQRSDRQNNESLAKANRIISNLKIQKARVTIIAMGIGLLCAVLLIVVICLSISNSNLESQIEALKKGSNSAVDYNPENNNNGKPSAPSTNVPSDGNNSAGNTDDLKTKAVAAYNNAKTLFETEKYLEAADLLATTELSYLDYADRSDAEVLYKNAVNKFSAEYFNMMYSNVAPQNWSAVIEYGLPVYRHNVEKTNPDFTYSGAAVCFNLGKAYEMTGDIAKAKEFYNVTITKYSSSSDAGYASYRLSLLG